MTDGSFIQHSSKAFEYRGISFWRILCQECANFAHEADSDFDGVVRGAFQEKDENLKSNDFVSNLLVYEMSEEGGRGMADDLET